MLKPYNVLFSLHHAIDYPSSCDLSVDLLHQSDISSDRFCPNFQTLANV